MSLRSRLRRAEKAAEVDMVVVPQPDGSVKRFHPDDLVEAWLVCIARCKAHTGGETLPEPHPLLDALYNASEEVINELSAAHGKGMVGFMAGEEEIYRGDAERPGPPVMWDEDGRTCR